MTTMNDAGVLYTLNGGVRTSLVGDVVTNDFGVIGGLNAILASNTTPAVIRGSVDLSTAPGFVMDTVGVGETFDTQRQANGVALQAAISWAATNGKFVEAPPGAYRYDSRTIQNAINTGLQIPGTIPAFVGASSHISRGSRFIQYAPDFPAITLGDIGSGGGPKCALYRNISAGYGVSQTGNVNAYGILLGRMYFSQLSNLTHDPYVSGVGGPYNAYVGMQVGAAFADANFSNQLNNIIITGGQLNYFRSVANGTGNEIGNLYLGQGGGALSGAHFSINGSYGGVINQLNCEGTAANRVLDLNNMDTLSIESLHVELNKMVGSDAAIIYANGAAVKIGSMSMLDNRMVITSGELVNACNIVLTTNANVIDINRLKMRWNTNGSGVNVSSSNYNLHKRYAGHNKVVCRIRDLARSGDTGLMTLDATLPAPSSIYDVPRQLDLYEFDEGLSRVDGAVYVVNPVGNTTAYGYSKNATFFLEATQTADVNVIASNLAAPTGIGAVMGRERNDKIKLRRSSAATSAFNFNLKDTTNTTVLAQLTAASTATSYGFPGN